MQAPEPSHMFVFPHFPLGAAGQITNGDVHWLCKGKLQYHTATMDEIAALNSNPSSTLIVHCKYCKVPIAVQVKK
jgi:hypothetical protein